MYLNRLKKLLNLKNGWVGYYSKSFLSSNKNELDPSKIATVGTIQDLRNSLVKVMGISKGYKPLGDMSERSRLSQYLPADQSELPPRTMNDSFSSALIPLSTDFELQDKYITFLGHVRIGRLLEDMDLFAAHVAFKHILNPKQPENENSPYTLVTVLVDKIDFTKYVTKPDEDIRLSGHVSWVGKSSIEVVVWLEQKAHGQWQKLTRALFLMAARNPTATKAAIINPLVSTNEEEQRILDGGESRKRNRKIDQTQQVKRMIPTEEEQLIIHDLFLKTVNAEEVGLKSIKLPSSNSVWMENCKLSNIVFSHPENRNLHNKVFGGFIMRQATELSWSLGFIYSKYRPFLKSISNISFHKPVEVSSLIKMNAYVVYSNKQFFQITLYAETLDSVTGKSSTTNVFNFTFEAPSVVPEVFPKSYQEAMMYIEGRRHFNNVMKSDVDKEEYLKP